MPVAHLMGTPFEELLPGVLALGAALAATRPLRGALRRPRREPPTAAEGR